MFWSGNFISISIQKTKQVETYQGYVARYLLNQTKRHQLSSRGKSCAMYLRVLEIIHLAITKRFGGRCHFIFPSDFMYLKASLMCLVTKSQKEKAIRTVPEQHLTKGLTLAVA